MENVIITPHMCGDTENYLDDLGNLFVDKALGFVPAGLSHTHCGPMAPNALSLFDASGR
jgi:phosphoglycerate dehydrogenase-like enzyme